MLRISDCALRALNKDPLWGLRPHLPLSGGEIRRCIPWLIAFLLIASRSFAQYNPIPNFTGTLAGQQFRNALNNKLSGSDTIAPQLVHLNFASLPATAVTGQLYYINDGAPGNPCRGSGSGAIAMGMNGRWVCSAPGSQIQNVLAYGAKADCTTPDDAAIQAAIDSASNGNTNDGSAPVYLPATAVQGTNDGNTDKCYLLGKPLVITHQTTQMYGDGREQTFLGANYYGPVLLAGTDTLSLGTSLLSGGGNSITLTGTPFIELSMLLRNRLNSLGTFSIEFEINVPSSPSNSVILQSAYDWPYQSYARASLTDVGAFALNYQSTNPHLRMTATLSNSGVVAINTANNSMGAGNHAVGFYYDGSHLWSCVDGTANTPTSATGSWVQSKWESITLPDQFGNGAITWPDGAGGNGVSNDSFNGSLDNLRISNIARASSGTCPAIPSAKFTYDSNTVLLLKGLSCGDGSQYCLENGTGQYAVYAQSNISPGGTYPTAGNGVWFPVLGHGGTTTQHMWLHDMALGWNYWTQGAYILNSAWSQFERLSGIGEHNGLNLYYLDYESTVRETRFFAQNHNGYQAYEFGYTSNTANAENMTAEQAFVCFNLESSQTGFEEKSGHCLVNGETAIAWLIDYGSGTLLDPFLDQETSDTMLAPIYFRGTSGIGGLSILNGNLDTYGGVPFIVHDANSQSPVLVRDTLFNNFAEDQAASSVIQYPGFLTWSSLIGTIWQGQSTAAATPTIANAPGTCTGSGGDTNCANFTLPGKSQFNVDGPCSLSVSSWSCQHNITTATTNQWLGSPTFTGAQGTFSGSTGIVNSYILFSGQVYLVKGANPESILAIGGLELSIPGASPAVDVVVSKMNAGNVYFVANAPSAGLYNFQLSFGVQSCCGTAAGLITPTTNVPYQPDRLDSVTIADSSVPLSNEPGNIHVIRTGGPEALTTTVMGTTSGQMQWSEPVSGGPVKQMMLNFQAYDNDSSTAQTISIPFGFVSAPGTSGSCPSSSFSVSTSTVSLPKSMGGTPYTGQCIVMGE
jgi:Pectate lyase superfamily protein